MTVHKDSSKSKTEMLFLVLALAAIGAALGTLASTDPQNRLIGFIIGGLVGIIVGVIAALFRDRRNRAADTVEPNQRPNPSSATTHPYPYNTRLTISNVYTQETIPVELVLLVSYEAHSPQVVASSSATSDQAASNHPGPDDREEVVRSLVTTEARRFVRSKSIESIETDDTFQKLPEHIAQEVAENLAIWQVEIDAIIVEAIKLPDDVIAGQVTQFLKESQAQTARTIEIERLAAKHKELLVLQHVAEDSYNRAKEAGMSNRRQRRVVLHQLLSEMKAQSTPPATWPSCLDELLASLKDGIPEPVDSVQDSVG